MRRVVNRVGWKAAVGVALCCAWSLVAGPAALAQLKPEPAPQKQRVEPSPEPQKQQDPQPAKETSPPPPPAAPPPPAPPPPAVQPPPASPPPVAVTPPPPAVVSPPAIIVQSSPPPPVQRSQPRNERPKPKATPNGKKARVVPKPKPKGHRLAPATIAALGREQASSVDGTLLAGGLALFVLVLADTVLLTLSTGVLRGVRT